MLTRTSIRRPWNRYRPVNYVADLPELMSGSTRQPPRWYHTNVEPRTGDNGEYERLHCDWTNQDSWIRVETKRLHDNSDYVVQCLMDSIHQSQEQCPVDRTAEHWTKTGYTPGANLAVTRKNVRDQEDQVRTKNYQRYRHFNLAMNPDQTSVPRRGNLVDDIHATGDVSLYTST